MASLISTTVISSFAGCNTNSSSSGNKNSTVAADQQQEKAKEIPKISFVELYQSADMTKDDGTIKFSRIRSNEVKKMVDKAVTDSKDSKELKAAADGTFVVTDKNRKDFRDDFEAYKKSRKGFPENWPFTSTTMAFYQKDGKYMYSSSGKIENSRQLKVYQIVYDESSKDFGTVTAKNLAEVSNKIPAGSFRVNSSNSNVWGDAVSDGRVKAIHAITAVPMWKGSYKSVWDYDGADNRNHTNYPGVIISGTDDAEQQVYIASNVYKNVKDHTDIVVIAKPNEFAKSIIDNTIDWDNDIMFDMFMSFVYFTHAYPTTFTDISLN